MKTDTIAISSQGTGMQDAFAVTEKLGLDCGLTKKDNLRLRLLAEELVGMLRGITGDVAADFFVEQEGKEFKLHLQSNVAMNRELRDKLLDASSTGENAAAKGFMGKLREMIAVTLLPDSRNMSLLTGLSIGYMTTSDPMLGTIGVDSYLWTMSKYKSEVESNHFEDGEKAEAWDELEKSIVANIADEVSVSIKGSFVEIIIFKKF